LEAIEFIFGIFGTFLICCPCLIVLFCWLKRRGNKKESKGEDDDLEEEYMEGVMGVTGSDSPPPGGRPGDERVAGENKVLTPTERVTKGGLLLRDPSHGSHTGGVAQHIVASSILDEVELGNMDGVEVSVEADDSMVQVVVREMLMEQSITREVATDISLDIDPDPTLLE